MTQHIEEFIQDCITVTADGSLASVDEVQGLYLHWTSLRTAPISSTLSAAPTDEAETDESEDGSPVLDALHGHGVETVQRDGIEYLEGIVLTGPVVADFILSCEFAGAWGQPDSQDLALLRDVASAS